jgi:hypothetical protein
MEPRDPTVDDIIRILSGDAAHMQVLLHRQQADIGRIAQHIPPEQRALTAAAVQLVLNALAKGEITPNQAQLWASFVRRGYVSSTAQEGQPIRAIEIPYQSEREDSIATAISRLDELGDVIDGTIDHDELRHLIAQLSSSSSRS